MDFRLKTSSFSNDFCVGFKPPIYRFPCTFVALRQNTNYLKIMIFLRKNAYFQEKRKKVSLKHIIKLTHKIQQKHGQKSMISNLNFKPRTWFQKPFKNEALES